MHAKSLSTLEYPKIVERLAREASFSASKALAAELLPSADADEVRRRLAYTTEARRVMDLRPDVGVRGARDVRPHVTAAGRGATLTPAELLNVLATLRSARQMGAVLAKLDATFPLLKALGDDLPARPSLEARIGESIREEGEVLACAPPALPRLRAGLPAAQRGLPT